jgi:hypothetical protein
MNPLRTFQSALLSGLGLASALSGCSAVVSDVGGVQFNPEACVQGGDTEVLRDAHLVFDRMEPHRASPTFVALIGGSTNPAEPDRTILRGRALISPSFAARVYDPGALTVGDPSRCATAAPMTLTMDVTIPDFIPPDSANGGPFEIDFWSETNGTPGRQPEDHTWVRPICDDGDVFFVHNTGFDVPVTAESNGTDLTVTADAIRVATALHVSEEKLARVPFVLIVGRQGQTVGYMRVIYACDSGPYLLRGILDVGSLHTLEAYFDVNLDGDYDPECDPHCSGLAMAVAGGTTVNFTGGGALGPDDFDVSRFCQVPAGFDSAACRP